MTNRPLHAVLVERAGPRLLDLLAAALDGSGPAIAPLDARLPPTRLAALVEALAPASVEGPDGVTTLRSGQKMGVAEGTAVIVPTSGSTAMPKQVELSAAALLHSARASLARIGARAGERWLCCLPTMYIAGLQVLVRSLVSGTDPVLADRADAQTVAASGCAHVSLVPTQLRRLLDEREGGLSSPLAGFSSVLLGGAAAPAGLLAAARAAEVPVVTTYGMTETCGGCVYDGLPLDGVQVKISHDKRIWIGGPVLFSGYRPGARGPWGDGIPPRAGGVWGDRPPETTLPGSGPATWAAWIRPDGWWCAAAPMTSSTPAAIWWSPARWRRCCRPARASGTWPSWACPTPNGANGS